MDALMHLLVKFRMFVLVGILYFVSSFCHALEFDFMNAPIGEFIRVSQEHLSYTVAFDEDTNKKVSFRANVSADHYQRFFEQVLKAYDYKLVKTGNVARLTFNTKAEITPNTVMYVFKHVSVKDIIKPLEKIMSNLGDYKINNIDTINAIALTGERSGFKIFLDLAKKLDIPQAQLSVEGVLIETTYSHMKSLGIDFSGASGGFSFNASSAIKKAGDLALSFKSSNFSAFLKAAESDSDISILSKPNLRVRNNSESKMQVGSDVPIVTGSIRQDDGKIYQTIDRAKVGLMLEIKGNYTGDSIALDLRQEVSTVLKNGEAVDLTFGTREITTSLNVQPGELVSFGGLISEKEEIIKNGVPYLKNLPFIGSLFGYESTNKEKTVLALFIKVDVIKNS